uniref:Uncharacterized protein n=1 Tax=Ciona savignyi TaxID=51511 RepID=H2Z618_CIOSA
MDGVSSIGSSEFHSEAYLEYRRRVFEQLAVEYEKEKQQKQQLEILPENELIEPSYDHNDLLHSSYYDAEEIKDESEDLLKQSPELQPAWDDSDLKSHAYISTPEIEIGTG